MHEEREERQLGLFSGATNDGGDEPQETAPFVPGSDTSREAAESVQPHLERLEAKVLHAIRSGGDGGLTDDEGEHVLGLAHQTYSARRRALVQKGLVEASDQRRPTRSGRRATVWVAR